MINNIFMISIAVNIILLLVLKYAAMNTSNIGPTNMLNICPLNASNVGSINVPNIEP